MYKRQRKALNRALQAWLTGRELLTPEQRIEQLYLFHRLRNFIWGLCVPQLDGAGGAPTERFQGVAVNQSPAFANDLVITDITASDSPFTLNDTGLMGMQLNVVGVPGVSIEDFFGAGQFLPVHYLADVTPCLGNAAYVDINVPVKSMEFVPRFLPAGQQFQSRWAVDPPTGTAQGNFGGEILVFHSVYALCENEPFACPSERVVRKCQEWVKRNKREYTILDLTIPFANLPTGTNQERQYSTEPQERPLLIFGAASNLDGVQIHVIDNAKTQALTNFYQCDPKIIVELDGSLFPLAGQLTLPTYLPIWGFAPATWDMGGYPFTYKQFSVPHFLEPGTSLQITLKNGLRDNTQTITTNGSLLTDLPAHIAFQCLTL